MFALLQRGCAKQRNRSIRRMLICVAFSIERFSRAILISAAMEFNDVMLEGSRLVLIGRTIQPRHKSCAHS